MADLKTELQTKVVNGVMRAPDAPKPKDEPLTRSRMTCTPVHVIELVERMGSIAQAAPLIGYTPSGLASSLGKEVIGATAEIAAEGVLREMDRKQGIQTAAKSHMLLVKVPSDKADALLTVFAAMGITSVNLSDME